MVKDHEAIFMSAEVIFKLASEEMQSYLGEKTMKSLKASKDAAFNMREDHITVFTKSEDQTARYIEAATSLAEEGVPHENGIIYKFPWLELPSPLIKIEMKNSEEVSVGGLNYSFGSEAFPRVRELMVANTAHLELGLESVQKRQEAGGEGTDLVSYSYVRTSSPDSVVVVTALSASVADNIG